MTPNKRKRPNDENATVIQTPLPRHRDPFRTPLQPRHTTNPHAIPPFTQSTPTFSPNAITFLDGSTPTPNLKKRRVVPRPSQEELQALRAAHQRKEQEQMADLEKQQAQREADQLTDALQAVRNTGLSIHQFLLAFLNTRDPSHSSQASQLLINHGHSILDAARRRQPTVMNDWAISTCRQLIGPESDALAAHFQPRYGATVNELLSTFSVRSFLSEAETVAPTICQTLRQIGLSEGHHHTKYKDRDLIVATTLCMLSKCRNDHSTEFQTTMALYLLASGTSRRLFDVLNHAGISLSYSQAIHKLKKLGEEHLSEAQKIALQRAFMLIWDNLNIAFKVSQQRQDSKDHFDDGTTATLVPLYGVERGALSLSMKQPRTRHVNVLNFDAEDLLPSPEAAVRVQEGQLWHIQDILYEYFPDLRKRLAESIPPPPSVKPIPIHKTHQCPLPTMHISESTLEGTLNVLKSIIQGALRLSDEDIREHGLIICAGDQLTLSLLDKVSAIRRDDKKLSDNVGRYTIGQDGLLHVKFAVTRMFANEYWGKANSKSPWSLWKINSLLGRKAISAGWKAKSLPPFRPVYELMLDLALPANILDGFRIYCPKDKLRDWVDSIRSASEVEAVAKNILNNLCSGRVVEKLRREIPQRRDVPFENICLFNRDALYLRQLKYSIKRGDVGSVLDLISHFMVAFRGTGHTPKYADALFQITVNLKSMDPVLREAWLLNWLANLSGKANSFKEMDLLQEHQNFWLKIVYNAKGSNRSWEWLSMVSLSIFALRDVMRTVQKEFRTPFNSTSHTNPSPTSDIQINLDYLESQYIQTRSPSRPNNDDATEARDLIHGGSDYPNQSNAYRNFRYEQYKTANLGVAIGESSEVGSDTEEGPNGDPKEIMDLNGEITFDDLLHDSEEYPDGDDGLNYVGMMSEMLDELCQTCTYLIISFTI